MRHTLMALVLVALTVPPVAAQSVVQPPARPERVDLSGPRVGITLLDPDARDTLLRHDLDPGMAITQIGWQTEKAFYRSDSGIAVLSEVVALIGGLEHNTAIPSITWMAGMRNDHGMEFGFGPNLSPTGVSVALAAGVTFRRGFVNIPVNMAVVPSSNGFRLSVLTGFNLRRR